MSKRKPTVDILGAVMAYPETAPSKTPATQTKNIEPLVQKEASASKEPSPAVRKTKHEEKIALKEKSNNDVEDALTEKNKATYFIDKNVLMNIDSLWLELRKNMGKKKVSKSIIIEEAAQFIYEDFIAQKEKSILCKLLEKKYSKD